MENPCWQLEIAKDAEAGSLAMEALQQQVMPFLLRRTKAEVLSDLPEKIIQDRYCNMSNVQLKLNKRRRSIRVYKWESDKATNATIDMRGMFGQDLILLHPTGVPVNQFYFDLQHGKSYFLEMELQTIYFSYLLNAVRIIRHHLESLKVMLFMGYGAIVGNTACV